MRYFVSALGLLALVSAGAAVTSGAAQGARDDETIRVYQSPT